MPSLGTVGHVTTAEAPATDDTLKSTALRDADAVDELADAEDVHIQQVTCLDLLRVVAELLDLLHGGQLELFAIFTLAVGLDAELGEVPHLGLGKATDLLVTERQLHGAVTVGLFVLT